MKKKSIFLLLPLLVSCEQSGYQIYLGNQILSGAKMDISSLSMREEHLRLKEEVNDTYYANVYVQTSQEELDAFYKQGFVPKEEQEKYPSLAEGKERVYFFISLPPHYQFRRRDNIQGKILGDENNILLTDNFYTYSTRDNLFFCYVDVVYDESIIGKSEISFFYTISSKAQFEPEEVRVFVNEIVS